MSITDEEKSEKKIKILWNKNNPTEVENAKKLFESYRKQGWIAITEKEGKVSMIFEFNAELECIILLPIIAGG